VNIVTISSAFKKRINHLRFALIMLIAVLSTYATADMLSVSYPVTTATESGTHPNIKFSFERLSDPIRPVTKYVVEWYPAGYPGWSMEQSASMATNPYIWIMGYAAANSEYKAQVIAYDSGNVEIGRTNLFTFKGENNRTLTFNTTMAYTGAQVSPEPTAIMQVSDGGPTRCVPMSPSTECEISVDIQHSNALDGATLYKDEETWSSLGLSTGTSTEHWTLDLSAEEGGAHYSVRAEYEGALIEIASLDLVKADSSYQLTYIEAECVFAANDDACEPELAWDVPQSDVCIFKNGENFFCLPDGFIQGSSSNIDTSEIALYTLRDNQTNELLAQVTTYPLNIASSTPCFNVTPDANALSQTLILFKEESGLPGVELASYQQPDGEICWGDHGWASEQATDKPLEINQTYYWQVKIENEGTPAAYSEMNRLITRPNIVMVYADDLGWNDVNTGLGNTTDTININTPKIKELADQGVVFSNAYANAANCSPSRASLMTGSYTPAHGVYSVSTTDSYVQIPEDFQDDLLAKQLQGMGYETAMLGKWHLQKGLRLETEASGPTVDAEDRTTPVNSGFTYNIGGGAAGKPFEYEADTNGEFFGQVAGVLPKLMVEYRDGSEISEIKKLAPVAIGETVDGLSDDLTGSLTVYAKKYLQGESFSPGYGMAEISRNKGKPFFLYFSHYAPHVQGATPLASKHCDKGNQAGTDHVDYVWSSADIVCLIKTVDTSLGEVQKSLNGENGSLNISDSTYLMFTSDNGMHRNWVEEWKKTKDDLNDEDKLYDEDKLLKGSKTFFSEAGIREPLIIKGPNIKPGLSDAPVIGSDLYATILGLAGNNVSEFDRAKAFLMNEEINVTKAFQNSVDLRGELGITGVEGVSTSRPLFWYTPVVHHNNLDNLKGAAMVVQKTIQGKNYKLISYFYPNKRTNSLDSEEETLPFEFYNLSVDPQEKCNLAVGTEVNADPNRDPSCGTPKWAAYIGDMSDMATEMCDFLNFTDLSVTNPDGFSIQMAKKFNLTNGSIVKMYDFVDPAKLVSFNNDEDKERAMAPWLIDPTDPADSIKQKWVSDVEEPLMYCGM